MSLAVVRLHGESMNEHDRQIALEFKERLSQVTPLLDFRVFGSRARGDAEEYSDMDVYIKVESLDRNLKETIRGIAWEIGFEHLIHISPLIFTREEAEDSPLRASPIIESITEEGVAV